jgi:hypothetical protein
MRVALAASFVVALLAPPAAGEEGSLHAPSGSVTLEYSAPHGCPPERELRDIVTTAIHRDPFASGAALPGAPVLRATVVRRSGYFSAAVELRNGAGSLLWQEPSLSDQRCSMLVQTIGSLVVPIVLDELPTPPPRRAPKQRPVRKLVFTPQELPPADPPRRSWWRPGFHLGARAAAAFRVAPMTTSSFSLDVGAVWKYASIAIEGRGDVPIIVDNTVHSATYAASLVPCGRYEFAFLCILFSAGAFHGTAQQARLVLPDPVPYVAAGARAGLEWPSRGALAVRASADVLGRGTANATYGGSPVGIFVGGGLLARFGEP